MTVEDSRRFGPHWLSAVATALALVAVALLGWTGTQLIAMRDDIHTLKDNLPAIQQQMGYVQTNINERLKLDEDRIGRLEDNRTRAP